MSIYLIGIIVSAFFFIVCFISTNNPLLSSLPALICLFYFVFIASIQITKNKKKVTSFKRAHQFMNNFIISLSIQPVLDQAINHSLDTLDSDFKDSIEGIQQLNPDEKLRFLANYFPFDSYRIFIDIVTLWEEQGGDILKMSSYLMNENREIDEYINSSNQMHNKKTVEFTMLWVFALSILIILRFALSQFYSLIITKPFFKIGVVSVFLFAIVSFQMLISKITSLEIKGWKKDGK